MNIVQAGYQLTRARMRGHSALLRAGAETSLLPVAYVLAVASRETNIQNLLGDGGHGVGIIQIDIRFHEIARAAKVSGSWRTRPGPLVHYGCRLLVDNLAWAQDLWPALMPDQHLKIAAAAYNAGKGGAKRGVADGDCDKYTTGKDYGRDVMARRVLFARLIGERNA